MKNKTTHYEILVWSGGTNHFTQKEDGDVYFFEISESKQALEQYADNLKEGYFGTYITVKKHVKKGCDCSFDEYGNNMNDCIPMEFLPKYVQKKIGKIVTLICDNRKTRPSILHQPQH